MSKPTVKYGKQDDVSYVGDEDDDAEEEDDDNTPRPKKKVMSEKGKLPARGGKKRQQHHLTLFSFCQHSVTSKNRCGQSKLSMIGKCN